MSRVIHHRTSVLSLASVCLVFLLLTGHLKAAFVGIGTSAGDPNNFASFTGATLDSITLNGTQYLTSELTQITMTGFEGANVSQILAQNGVSTGINATERRDLIETDWRGDTGLINPTTSVGSFTADFNAPVQNIDGVDMFLFEITSTTGDNFQITINGVELTVLASDYGETSGFTSSADVLVTATPVANLNELLTDSLSSGSTTITQDIFGVGIDFSDFGVALGDSVSSFSLRSFTPGPSDGTIDPVIIAAVPEPTTSVALLVGALALAARLHRRRR